MASLSINRRQFLRSAFAVLLIVALLASIFILGKGHALFTRQMVWRAMIALLVALEFAYLCTVLAAVIVLSVIGFVIRQATHWRTRSTMLGRGLVLCISWLLAAALAEGFAVGWRAWSHRLTPLAYATASLPGGVNGPSENEQVTVTVLGESSAAGVPFDSWLSVGKIIAWQLEEALPGKRCRLELLAKPGDTLAGQYQRLAAIRHRPDVLIVYCGHNEFDSVIPWSHRAEYYLDDKVPPYLVA